jgi:cell division protein YceG involved in septum cleavage
MASYNTHGRRRTWLKILLVLCILVVVVLGVGAWWLREQYNTNLQPVSASQQNQLITVPTGSSAKDIAAMLKQNGTYVTTTCAIGFRREATIFVLTCALMRLSMY